MIISFIHSFIHSFNKKSLKVILLLSIFLTPCLIYLSCKKVDSEISIYEKFATDSDVKQLIILINESSRNYTFLNPNNTKEQKNQIMEDLKSYSSKTDEYSQLQVLKIYGYSSFEEYAKYAKETNEIAKRLNEKFPNLKSFPLDSLRSAFSKAKQQVQSQLSYIISPNKFGVASIYQVDDLKQLQSRKRDCCYDIWQELQLCYSGADAQYALNVAFCIISSFGCTPLGPWGVIGCGVGCIGYAGIYYGTQLDICTGKAYTGANSCTDPCF